MAASRRTGTGRALLASCMVGSAYMTVWNTALPLIPLYAAWLGASAAVVGLVVSATAALPLALGVHAGAAADALGPLPVARGAAVLLAAAFAVVFLGPGLAVMAAALSVAGLAHLGLTVATQACVARLSRPDERVRNFGYFAFWVSFGMLAGPILGGVLVDLAGYRAAFGFVLLMAGVTWALAWWLRLPGPSSAGERSRPAGVGGALKTAGRMLRERETRLVLLVAFVMVFAFSLKQSFYPLYLQGVGMSTTLIGTIFSIQSLCSMVVRPLVGATVARLGHRRVLLLAMGLAVAGIAATPLFTTFWPLTLAASTTGLAMGFTQPITMSLIAERADARSQGVGFGLRLSMQRLAQLISPPLFGLATTAFGLGAAFYLAALVLGTGVITVARLTRPAAEPGTAGLQRARQRGG